MERVGGAATDPNRKRLVQTDRAGVTKFDPNGQILQGRDRHNRHNWWAEIDENRKN